MVNSEFRIQNEERGIRRNGFFILHSSFFIRTRSGRAVSIDNRQSTISNRGFTLIELLVVVAIIAVLAAAVLVASTSVFGTARSKNTLAVLEVVKQAVEQFQSEQKTKPTVSRTKQGGIAYADRYGQSPPDELEPFTTRGIPGSVPPASKSIAVNWKTIIPEPDGSGYRPMKFYTSGGPDPDEDAFEHRDLAAMVLGIEQFSQTATSILDRLPERNRSPGPLRKVGKTEEPAIFLDRSDKAPKSWDSGDLQIRYVLDDWGVPIGYFSQRVEHDDEDNLSSNHPDWSHTSGDLVKLNGGQPVIFSWGPNGKDQLTKEAMEDSSAKASIVVDWEEDHRLNHILNEDNLYANPALKAKLVKAQIE